MTISEQIAELNSSIKCYLAPSKLHGVGVFALRDIEKGKQMYLRPNKLRRWYSVPLERFNELRPEIAEIIFQRWASVVNKSLFQSPNDDAWLILFMNHSENANYEVRTDTALRDIKKGEEVTEDYRQMVNAEAMYPFLNRLNEKKWYDKFLCK